MIKLLKRGEEYDTYLTHVCRHRWSRKSLMKRLNIRSFQPTLAFISSRCRLTKVPLGRKKEVRVGRLSEIIECWYREIVGIEVQVDMLFQIVSSHGRGWQCKWMPVNLHGESSYLSVSIHTQYYQLPFQECWSVCVIHKLPDATPNQVCHQYEMAFS